MDFEDSEEELVGGLVGCDSNGDEEGRKGRTYLGIAFFAPSNHCEGKASGNLDWIWW